MNKQLGAKKVKTVYLVGITHKYEGGFDVMYICGSRKTARKRFDDVKTRMMKELDRYIKSSREGLDYPDNDGNMLHEDTNDDARRYEQQKAALDTVTMAGIEFNGFVFDVVPCLFEIPWCSKRKLEE